MIHYVDFASKIIGTLSSKQNAGIIEASLSKMIMNYSKVAKYQVIPSKYLFWYYQIARYRTNNA